MACLYLTIYLGIQRHVYVRFCLENLSEENEITESHNIHKPKPPMQTFPDLKTSMNTTTRSHLIITNSSHKNHFEIHCFTACKSFFYTFTSKPGAIEELFDTIDYSKGGAVVRMVATALDSQYGKGVWSATIENYLNLHKYDNAEANDLWNRS